MTTIAGPAKGGKSAFAMGAVAAALGYTDDCLGWVGADNRDGKAVIHLDTEQSRPQFDTSIRRRLGAGVNGVPPANFKSVSLGGWDVEDIMPALNLMIDQAIEEHGGVHSIFIDGVSDLVPSVNDEEASTALVRKLLQIARRANCPVICVLHVTQGEFGMVNARGHLGRDLERKCETVLQLSASAGDNHGLDSQG